MNDNFKSVKSAGPMWEPKQTGRKIDNSLQPLNATDKSFIDGYYLGARTNMGQEQNSTLHSMRVKNVGDKNHIIGDPNENNGEVSIWGTGVLDDLLSKIRPGQYIRICWLGKSKSKNGGREYHDWDVLLDDTAEPMRVEDNYSSGPDESSISAAEITKESAEVSENTDMPSFLQGNQSPFS